MRKSRILTFLFALWPGAGQMYLGYMKRGLSLMGVFCLLIAVAGFLNLSILLFLLPVVWFYAFFDTLNLRSMSYEFLPQDDFLFHLDSLSGGKVVSFFRQRHLLAGILLIVVGVYMLAELLLPAAFRYLNIDLYPIFNALPTILIASAIIWLGVRLIRSSVVHKAIEDDYQEYHGDTNPQ